MSQFPWLQIPKDDLGKTRLFQDMLLLLRRLCFWGSKAGIFTGNGTPEGAVTADIGSLFLREDGGASTTLYVKESGTGNTGWIAK